MKLQLFSHTLSFVFTVVEGKYGILSTIEEGDEADSENEVIDDNVMVETLAQPSAAIQNSCHPDVPSPGPLIRTSAVMCVADIGLQEVSNLVLF